MKKLLLLAALLATTVVVLAGCGGGSEPDVMSGDEARAELQIAIEDNGGSGYVESCVTITEGTEFACQVSGQDYAGTFTFRVDLVCDDLTCQASWTGGGYSFDRYVGDDL